MDTKCPKSGLFGGKRLIRASNKLLSILSEEEERQRIVPIFYPPEDNVGYKIKFLGLELPVRHYFSSLTLPYIGISRNTSNLTIFCGPNIANEFALPLALASHTFCEVRPNIKVTELSLVADENGERMSRKRTNILYLHDLENIVQKIMSDVLERNPDKRNLDQNLIERMKRQTLIYGVLGHIVTDEKRNFDLRLFREGLLIAINYQKLTDKLNHSEVERIIKTGRLDTNNTFVQAVRKKDMSKALRIFSDKVKKSYASKAASGKELQECLTMAYYIFGNLAKKIS